MVYGPSTNYSQSYYAAARPEIPNPGLSYSTPQPPQLSHIDIADTKELEKTVDMIKDLAETMYYCTITEAMEE